MDIQIVHLINDTYQVVDTVKNTVLHQGSMNSCVAYKVVFQNPELLGS